MTLAGFVTFVDPVRSDASGSLRELANLVVSLRMLTGGSRAVAVDVARRVGMPTDGALRGSDLDLLPFVPILPVQMLVQNLLYDCAQLALPWDRVDVASCAHRAASARTGSSDSC
jgi:magnesium-transporting ATPase (P-type)